MANEKTNRNSDPLDRLNSELEQELITLSLRRVIKQSGAVKRIEAGLGDVVCTNVHDGQETLYALVYMDENLGPFLVIPRKGIEFRQTKSLTVAAKMAKNMGVEGIVKTMEFEEILAAEQKALGQ